MTSAALPPRSAHIGLLQVCAAGVLWGTGGLVVTLLNDRDGLGAMTVSAWRMLIGALTMLLFALATRHFAVVVSTMRRHPLLAVLVGSGTAAYQGLYFASVLMVGVSVATVISLGLAPVITAVWEHVAAGTQPSWREAVVLAAALSGLVLITLSSGEAAGGNGEHPVLGLALAVCSGATYAATTLVGRVAAQKTDAVALTTCATATGAVVLLPFLVVAGLADDPVLTSDAGSLALLAYLGTATMALSYGLLYAGLRTTPGSAATIATLVEPLSAALLAALLLDERMPWPGLVGGALILGAVAALRPEETQPPPA